MQFVFTQLRADYMEIFIRVEKNFNSSESKKTKPEDNKSKQK